MYFTRITITLKHGGISKMTYDPKRAWNIAATEITLPDSDGYFLYIKVPTASGENTSEFIVDKGYVVPSRDAGYFICPWGYIHPPVGGSREYSPYWGNKRGANGQSAYVYIAYASAADGTGFTMTFNAALDYIAIKATTTPIASPAASDFAGLWKNYKGVNGQDGSQPLQITGITLTAANWTLVSGLYEYDLANANITANSIVDVIPANSSIAIVKAAEVLPETDSSTGSVKLYATNAPTGDITVTINITEKQV